MRSRIAYYIILVLLLVLLISACTLSAIPDEVETFYIAYLEATKSGISIDVIDNYCHYEIPEMQEMALASGEYLIEYNILKWERLSSQLWVVTTELVTNYVPEGVICINYIGLYQNGYRVMTSLDQIPSQLKKDVDFSGYNEGVSYFDIIFPDE